MKFGKIDYLNLLPFDIFIKKYQNKPPYFTSFMNYNKSYPSKLNKEFLFRRIDAGFISSIVGMNSYYAHSGIISHGSVWSVIVIKNKSKLDYQSASSNALSKILNIDGQVLIGDRALKYIENNNDYVDLGLEWYKKHNLPFVFGLLCFNSHKSFYKNLSKNFNKTKIYIPKYILDNKSKETNLSPKYIKMYLSKINYNLNNKCIVALYRFYREIRIKNIKVPKRF